MATLTFVSTQSLASFKNANSVVAINIIKNPTTGKRFFVSPDNSNVSGKIANELDTKAPLSVSLCSDDQGVTFNMLHNTPDNSANIVETL